MSTTAIVDTNVLVYRYDPRDRARQDAANELLAAGAADGSLALTHQTLVEFASVVSRPLIAGRPMVAPGELAYQLEELLGQFEVLYPTEHVLRTALRGAGTYGLSWYDAHLWAYAESFGVPEIWSEDLQHGRAYGHVRVRNPFVGLKE